MKKVVFLKLNQFTFGKTNGIREQEGKKLFTH
jgi:hypothetical protein